MFDSLVAWKESCKKYYDHVATCPDCSMDVYEVESAREEYERATAEVERLIGRAN
jgi:hypothetical protein